MTNSFYDPRFLNKMRIYRLKVEFNTRFFFKLFHLIDNSAIKIDLGLCLLKKIETGAASKNYEDNVSDGDDLIDMAQKISMAEMDDVDDIDDMIDDDEKFDYEGTTQTLESTDESNAGSATKNNNNITSRKKKKK